MPKHDDAGRSLPGFIFAFVFYRVDVPHRLCDRTGFGFGFGFEPGNGARGKGGGVGALLPGSSA